MASGKDFGGSQKKGSGGIGQQLGQGMGSALSGQRPANPPSGPDPAQQEREALAQRASSLGSRLSGVRSSATLGDIRGSLGRLDSLLAGLPGLLEEARRGGYVYKGYLEKKIEVLRQQWQGLRTRIDSEAAQQGRQLSMEADRLQQRLSAMGTALSAPTLDALERDVGSLESKVRDITSTLESTFGTLESNAQQTEQQVKSSKKVLDQVAAASFRLRQGENIVDAVGAQHLTDGEKEGPKGFLYLTDQRLLFEQNEKVATKKFLFVTTASERVQKLIFEAPVGAVEQARPSERGALMFKKEIMELSLTQGDITRAVLRLEADSEDWSALIGRARSGELAGERVGAAAAAPAAVTASPANVPTKCPTCGATLPELVRGQMSLSCDFCGTVVRV
jgi:hypothetical protein